MLPIRLQQFPQFVKQTIERSLVLRRTPNSNRTFHLCYFSCQSYFKYLYCSLHSLIEHGRDITYKVIIFSDEEQPLSQAQISAIKILVPSVQVIAWPKSMGWGSKQISSIWHAYEIAAKGAKDEDIVARVDSDVFFFNDTIFRVVERSNADLVGDGHYVNFEYCQGGCYFFRASAVRQICALLTTEPIETILNDANIVVEDVAASYFAQRLGLKTWHVWFMMFPDELRNAGGLTPWQRWKFSCAHFVMKNKTAMLEAYEREVLASSPPEWYTRTLDIN